MTQVRTIISESLEAKVRELLPSQNGFTEELSAQSQIVPIIDLTSAAEGSTTPQFLQTAWDFATGFTETNNTTNDLITTTGFWKISYVYRDENVTNNTVTALARLFLDDGATEKTVWQMSSVNSTSGNETIAAVEDEFYIFVPAGQTLKAFTSSTRSTLNVIYRQVADVNGTLVNPLGFTPQ